MLSDQKRKFIKKSDFFDFEYFDSNESSKEGENSIWFKDFGLH